MSEKPKKCMCCRKRAAPGRDHCSMRCAYSDFGHDLRLAEQVESDRREFVTALAKFMESAR